MLESIQTWLGLPNHMYVSISLISLITMFFAIILSYSIKLVLVNFAKKRQKKNYAFIFNAIRLPITVSIILIGLHQALGLMPTPTSLDTLLPKIFKSIDLIIWGQFFFRSVRFSLKSISQNAQDGQLIRPQTLPLFENISAVVIILIFTYLLFITWQIDMSAWLASAGIIGIAVGFAAKDTIANLLSGVFILADSPYKIGDYIVIDSGERGMVTHIGLRSTRILTRDDLEINVPNAIIANGKIINESSGRHIKSRTRVQVSVAYDVDIDHVKNILMDVAKNETQICTDPEPRIRFRRFGASGLELELLVWIDDPEIRGRVIDSLNTQIYKRFAIEHIEIPYSKHDLYIKSLPKKD
ncbi:mechanosensitive ion channel family protein [Thiomicrorhabdus lithotrophica]|uniref:Small-conductance mechanosensitive channel n=1 Tax=Thiomicrorhabdus lithotrophica TaxID=2949997 RepID=A0ABY8CBD7_9GAMM|nr:mechanosensitive ion channel family protein [Thiomicrorhabdus lithotrophica]WEJ62537.1 mechanosensitive ion channel family protein [Thiomicrorhabdus lithotrophica]